MQYENGKINGNNKKIYNKYTNTSLSIKRYYYENRTIQYQLIYFINV